MHCHFRYPPLPLGGRKFYAAALHILQLSPLPTSACYFIGAQSALRWSCQLSSPAFQVRARILAILTDHCPPLYPLANDLFSRLQLACFSWAPR